MSRRQGRSRRWASYQSRSRRAGEGLTGRESNPTAGRRGVRREGERVASTAAGNTRNGAPSTGLPSLSAAARHNGAWRVRSARLKGSPPPWHRARPRAPGEPCFVGMAPAWRALPDGVGQRSVSAPGDRRRSCHRELALLDWILPDRGLPPPACAGRFWSDCPESGEETRGKGEVPRLGLGFVGLPLLTRGFGWLYRLGSFALGGVSWLVGYLWQVGNLPRDLPTWLPSFSATGVPAFRCFRGRPPHTSLYGAERSCVQACRRLPGCC